MNFSSNIKYLRKRRKRTQEDVAFVLGLKRSTLNNYENGQTIPNATVLMAFSDYYKIAIDTLLRIDLSRLSEHQLLELERGNDVYIRGSGLRVLATTVNSSNEENIELVNEKAKAGYVTGYADPEYIKDLPVFRLPFLSANRKYRSFQVTGDSMLPLPDGSWVTGEFVGDWHTIISGRPYIILTLNDGVVFKIADNLIGSEGALRLYSLNPFYEPYDLPVGEIREVWRFVNFISTELPATETTDRATRRMMAELKNELKLIRKKLDKPINR
ncbi:MAG: XRE family transcriptional regulator [Bacteroidales bacterium]